MGELATDLKSKYHSVLSKGGELSFAIEGKYTNLRVFSSNGKYRPQRIYCRLDCYKQYSTPLNMHTLKYPNKDYDFLRKLLDLGGFDMPMTALDEIITIILPLTPRALLSW